MGICHDDLSCLTTTYNLSASKKIILLGVLCKICCIPLFFRHDNEDAKEDSAFLETVQSNSFENMILISLALSIPSVLDIMADIFEKKNKLVLDDEQLSRIFLSLSLLSQPLLFLQFAVRSENLIATYAIKNIRAISCATIVGEQLHKRCSQVFTFKISLGMLFLWCVGSVVGSYTTSKDPATALAGVAMAMKGLGGIILTVSLCRYYISISKDIWNHSGNLENRYERWHTIAFELLIIATLIANSTFDLMYSFKSVYDFCEMYVVSTAYLATFFQFLYSNLMTQQYRFELVVMKEKLAIKRQFVRYVSHEIRTPLNSCALGLSYLRKRCVKMTTSSNSSQDETEDESDSMLSVIDEISDCCDTAVDFMNNMLLFDKIDTLDFPSHFKKENLSDICKKSFQSFQLSARHLSIDLSFEVHETLLTESSLPFIRGDSEKIFIVFKNLISNALQYSAPNGEVKIKIIPISVLKTGVGSIRRASLDLDSPSLSTEATTHYRVIVEDKGIGISRQEQSELFGRIMQFNPGESEGGGGSGMGLFLSQKIAAEHGTKLQVQSEGIRGKGSKFYVDFPKYQMSKDDNKNKNKSNSKRLDTLESVTLVESQVAPTVTCTLLSRPLNEIHIMIVDDSKTTRKMVSRVFKMNNIGGIISEAGDGVELLNIMCPDAQQRKNSLEDGAPDSVNATANTSSRNVIGRTRRLGSKNYQIHPSLQSPPTTFLKTYDIIIMDKCMPLMNGDVATAKLRELGYDGIIFGLTGNALAEDLDEFCKMGANYTFTKPLNMSKFIQIIGDFYLAS